MENTMYQRMMVIYHKCKVRSLNLTFCIKPPGREDREAVVIKECPLQPIRSSDSAQ